MGTKSTALAVAAGILCSGAALASWDFDHRLAETYAGLFAPAMEGQTGKALHCIQPKALLKWLSQGEPVTGLDIRTPAETGVFGLALPGSLRIPLHELFTPDHLDQIPQDRKVIVLCQTGMRAGMATLALRHLGYEQVYVLQGGYQGLTAYLDPGTAYAHVPSFHSRGQAGVPPKGQAGAVTRGAAANGGNEDGRQPALNPWPPTGAAGYPAYGHHPLGYLGWRSGRADPHWRAGPGPRSWHALRWHLTRPSPPLPPPPAFPPSWPGSPFGMPPP